MKFPTIDRLMKPRDERDEPEVERRRLIERHVQDRRNHQFSDSIGGDSANYREPKFGSRS